MVAVAVGSGFLLSRLSLLVATIRHRGKALAG